RRVGVYPRPRLAATGLDAHHAPTFAMTASTSINDQSASDEDRARLRTTYIVEGALSFAANLLFIGIFFYTAKVFGWGLVRNFLLAAAQGFVYMVACLLAGRASRALGK